jgi:hypothetical protein
MPGRQQLQRAGDLLCDTPADPGLNDANVQLGCNYVGTRLDHLQRGQPGVQPGHAQHDELHPGRLPQHFTPQQVSRAISTLTGPRWGEIGFNSPDFDFFTPTGWTNALVPRNTGGATPGSCTVTSFLAGNSNTTRLNQAVRQGRLDSHNPGVDGRIYLDNEHIWNYSYGGGTWSGQQYYNNFGPITVRGGRHALHSHVDYLDEVCESNEGDNLRYTQYVWSPTILSPGTSVLRDAPPEPMTANFTFPNCDGLQFNAAGWWSAVALQPTGTFTDYDLRLYDDYTGSTQGFGTPLVESSYGNGVPDWVLINHHHVDAGYGGNWQVGVTTAIASSLDYRLEHRQARTLSKTDGTRICGLIGANRVMDIFEVYFSADDIADSWTVTLSGTEGTDLDLYLYPDDEPFMGRSQLPGKQPDREHTHRGAEPGGEHGPGHSRLVRLRGGQGPCLGAGREHRLGSALHQQCQQTGHRTSPADPHGRVPGWQPLGQHGVDRPAGCPADRRTMC